MEDQIIYTIEGKEYTLVDTIAKDQTLYIFLMDDSEELLVQKHYKIENETVISGLADEDEVKMALKMFYDKNENLVA